MEHKVEKFIEKHGLLATNDKVLVALSGGADSVALLLVLLKLNYRCTAIHCNFHLRGEESDRDEQFTTALCKRLGVELEIVHFNTAEHAKNKGISIEMAARELRYKAFEEQRCATGAHAIAVAHHRDDSAETLLLNLVRGTGIRGLCGIHPKNGYIVRPLLCVDREEITDYLKWRNEDYVTDSTNLTSDYTRNKIRLEVIPGLAEINPSVKESIAATAERMIETENIYRHAINEAVKRVKKDNVINIRNLKREIAPSTLLHEILSPLGFNSSQTDEMAAMPDECSGKQFHAGNWCVTKDRNRFIITASNKNEHTQLILPPTGCIRTENGNLTIERHAFDGNIPREKEIATFDANKIKEPLTLRNVQNGDRFAPFGMRGTKLVSDYLTDRKKSIIEKQQQLVVTDSTGEIAWIVDERPSAKFGIDNKTQDVIVLQWKKV